MFACIFVFVLLVFSIISRSLKIDAIFNYLVFALITSFFVFNRDNNDYQGYIDIFNDPSLYAEPGYVVLVNAIKLLGGSHEGILLVLGLFVGFTFLRLGRYSSLMSFAAICYFIFPMPIDITQVRNTFVLLLFINSLVELSRGRLFFSLLFVLLGVSFHYFGIVYLLIWFGLLFRGAGFFNYAVLLCFVISLTCVPIFIGYFGDSAAARTFAYYIAGEPKYHSFFIWGIPVVVDIFLILYFFRRLDLKRHPEYQLIFVFESVIIASFAFLPGLLYVDEFNRLYRVMFILKYFLVALVVPFVSFERAGALIVYALFSASIMASHYAVSLDYDRILFGM